MNQSGRFLTKSLFNLGLECPTKIFYSKNPGYANRNADNDFLKALADGGFQVGALARCMFPGGHLIETLDKAEAVAQTTALLSQLKVTIFEGAIQTGSLLIRADVLVKNGNTLTLFEVKAKSWSPDDSFLTKREPKRISSDWGKYLYDVAFQTYVLKQAFPAFQVTPHLMLIDKSKQTSIDGLNQKFKINPIPGSSQGRIEIVGDVSPDALGTPILTAVPVDEEVEGILDGSLFDLDGKRFHEVIASLTLAHVNNQRIPAVLGKQCKGCEYKATPEELSQGLRSGFHQCWGTEGGLTAEELKRPAVFELWRFPRAGDFIADGKLLIEDLTEADLPDKESRQYLQYKKVVTQDPTPFIDRDGLKTAMDGVKYPLHFIDFETSMLAIPFHQGRRPYEQYAFQFSHHQMEANGSYAHVDQYLGTEPGFFPNFDFLRALKKSLEKDSGTVFRYAMHENTVLNQITAQLEVSREADRAELINFCHTLTHHKDEGRVGDRDMVDMLEWVKNFYYHPAMKGSNSIKAVFPAILNSSKFLQEKYSNPVYGREIKSLNFGPTVMVEKDPVTGDVVSPYKKLPPVLEGQVDESEAIYYRGDEVIREGGSASTAFARLQLSDVSPGERKAIEMSLLRYCEIDTLAMVMIWEAWSNWN